MSKSDELRQKVGSTETHYCGKCGKETPHIWIEKSEGVLGWTYVFYLKCRKCGKEDRIYSTG